MKLAVSNLAWGTLEAAAVRDVLRNCGIAGVELAPTALWPTSPAVDPALARGQAEFWRDAGMTVSGLQSLLFGHPELQLFNRDCHEALLKHLTGVVELTAALGARYVVFGSPKNRVRGDLTIEGADAVATEFFTMLLPVLEREGVMLMLEPNAPQYGADYLTDYDSCVRLANLVASARLQPQIDTGCLSMAGVDSAAAVRSHVPSHVHVSAPMLGAPPGEIDHDAVRVALDEAKYDGWCTLEVLAANLGGDLDVLRSTVEWFVAAYGATCSTTS